MTKEYRPQDIEILIQAFSSSNWDEFSLEVDGLSLFLSTDPSGARTKSAPVAGQAPASANLPKAAPAPITTPASASGPVPDSWIAIKAPNLGTFYRSPKPGAAPFVNLGDRVDPDSEICLIEVMKLFTAVKAGIAGTVKRICAADAELVEGDQILFFVEPA